MSHAAKRVAAELDDLAGSGNKVIRALLDRATVNGLMSGPVSTRWKATVATTKTKAEALATVGIITPDVEIREAADATDDDETANQDRGDDLDRTEADRGQPTLAPGTPDGPVGHDHGGAPSEPESATQSDPASAPPGRAPTTEVAS